MTDDQRPDDLPDETVRDVLAATGDRPTPEFVAALRSTLTDAAGGRTTAPVVPVEAPPRRRLPLLAAAAVVALVVAGVTVLALQDGDGEIATTPPTSAPTDTTVTTTTPPGSTPDHPTTAEQLTAWVGIRLNGIGNGAVNGDYPWFVIESVDVETGALSMSGNDGCNDWESRGTIVDGHFEFIDGTSDNAECDSPGFAPGPDDVLVVREGGIDIERDGDVFRFGPDPVQGSPVVAALAGLVGDQLVVVGPEYGPAVLLRIERVAGDLLTVDGIDECNGYFGEITIDASGVVAAAELEVNANACSGPPSSGAIRIGDVLDPSGDGLTIERDGVEFRLLSLDAMDTITDPAEIAALGEIRINGGRARFGEPGVVEIDGCELAWTVDGGRLTAPAGDADDPVCANAEPGLIAYGLQNGGVTLHRSAEGLWARALGRRATGRVDVPPPPGTLLDRQEDHVGRRFVDQAATLPGGGLPWIELDWLTDERVRLTLDVGCGPEQLDLLLGGDEVTEVVEGADFDGLCTSAAMPKVGDRLVLNGGVEIQRDDGVQRFTWIDAVPRYTDPIAGSFLLNGERITFQDGTVSWGDCTQPFTRLGDGVVAFPLDDDPRSCGTLEPPSRLYELRELLFGGVTLRPAGDDLILERHGFAARLVPDAAGAPTPFDLQRGWRLIGWIDPPQTTSVEPHFALGEQVDGYYITLFDGCSQVALQTGIDAGVITSLELVHGPPTCPDADVPFEPVMFRVGDRFEVDGSRLSVVAPDGTVRYLFDSTPGTNLSPTVEDLTGVVGDRSWRPAGSGARPLRFVVDADGTLRLEYGSCSSPMFRDPGFRMPEWPADSTCFEDASWIERAVARELGFAATTTRSDPFRIAGAELQIQGDRRIRLEPVP